MGNMQEVLESGSLLEQVTGDLRIAAGVSVVLLLLLWGCFRSGRRSQVTVVFKRLDAAGLQQLSATVTAAVAEARPSANDEALQRVAEAVERLKTLQYQFQNDIIKAHEQIWQGLCNFKERSEPSATLQPLLTPLPITEEPQIIPELPKAEEPRKLPSKPASRKVSETLPEEPAKPETQPVAVEEKPRPPPAKLPIPLKKPEVPVTKLPETTPKFEEPPKPPMKDPEPIDDLPKPSIKPSEPAQKAEEPLRPPVRPPEPTKEFPKPPELPKKPQNLPKPPKLEEMKQPPTEEKKEGEAPTGRPTPPMRKPGLVRPKYTPPTTLGNPFGAK